MQGVRVEKIDKGVVLVERMEGKIHDSKLFSLPKGKVSSLPERNKDLQLTRATEKKREREKDGWWQSGGEKSYKGKDIKESRCAQWLKCACQYLHAACEGFSCTLLLKKVMADGLSLQHSVFLSPCLC